MSSQSRPDPLSELAQGTRRAAEIDMEKTFDGHWVFYGGNAGYSSADLRWIAEELDLRNAEETET